MTTKEIFKYRGYTATCKVETIYIDLKTKYQKQHRDKKNYAYYFRHVTTIKKDDETDYFIIYTNRNRYIKWAIDKRIASHRS